MSENGWTTDELGLEWLKHFNKYTESCTTGVYRLLILDGYGSHGTPEFDQYCTENRIISLCMLAHTSHLLQPLDVSCFSPLKTAYGHEVGELARQGVFHIDKDEFLDIYPRIHILIFSEQNIKSGFRATGLVPYNPERVLSSLTVVRTPSPPLTAIDNEITWTVETPHTVAQLQQQAQLVRDLVNRQSQSPTNQAISQLVKGCQLAMHSATILTQENIKLRAANNRQKHKREQRRQYIASGGVLQAQEGQLLIAEADRGLVQADQNTTSSRQRAPPTCSICHTQGHSRTQYVRR